MVRALRADARADREHTLGRFAEGYGDDPLALRQAFAGAQEERHAGPAPVVDHALQGDECFRLGFRIHPLLGPVAMVLAAHHVLRLDRHHAAKDLVLLLADRLGFQGGRGLHRHEGEYLEQVRHHHVAIGAGLLIERGAPAKPERLGHVDLHVVDEVAVPDRLEQPVGEAEGQNVLRRLLAEEVVDAKDLVLGEHLVQPGIQQHRAGQVGAERLLHDDPGACDEIGFGQQAHRGQGGRGRHAEVVDPLAVAAQTLLGPFHRRLEYGRTGGQRHVIQGFREGRPVGIVHLAGEELVDCAACDRAEALDVDIVQRHADDPAAGDEPRARQVKQARKQLAAGKVAGGTDENDDLGIARPDAGRNFFQNARPVMVEPPGRDRVKHIHSRLSAGVRN